MKRTDKTFIFFLVSGVTLALVPPDSDSSKTIVGVFIFIFFILAWWNASMTGDE